MSTVDYEESRKYELEAFSVRHFAMPVTVRTILFDDLTVSSSATMTVFTTTDNAVYGAIESTTLLRLGDIERIIKESGFKASHYVAPGGHKSYFTQHAYNIFSRVYPARTKWTKDQEEYYQLLVPYSPALVKLNGLSGSVRQYNPFGNTWHVIYRPSNRMQISKA